MAKRLVKAIPLDNGLTLELHDASKPIAGDRWMVSCVASAVVSVDGADAEILSAAGISKDGLRNVLGDAAVFEKEMKRNFVDENDLAEVKDGLFGSMAESLVPYLSLAMFPSRFLVRKYQEYQTRSAWPANKR